MTIPLRRLVVIRRRYEVLSMLNDFAIGSWFLVGSVFFLYPSLMDAGVWLFIVGSAQFLLRPIIRLAHRLHLQRIPASNWEF
ncbi:YrhK family protein [Arhodomonas sp. AD133]|uniref:YrhK family protein n=1 Tax=Arhodomonas sp. AD133 TaxID=3415009 RepID=UPI003EBFF657